MDVPAPLSKDSVLTDDLRAIVDAFEAIERQADALCASLTEAQFNWQPEAGRRWSVGQCLDHLNITASGYLPAVTASVAKAREAGLLRRGPVALSIFGRLMVANLEPPPRFRMPAPKPMQPASRLEKAAVCARFQTLREQLRAIARDYADVDFNRATLTSPFASVLKMKVSTAFLSCCAHDRRHLWQARGVRDLPDFPTV